LKAELEMFLVTSWGFTEKVGGLFTQIIGRSVKQTPWADSFPDLFVLCLSISRPELGPLAALAFREQTQLCTDGR
jgi:hypothetical protein